MTQNKALPILLHELSNFIIEEVETTKEKNQIHISQETYVKPKIIDFTYEKGFGGLQYSFEKVTKDEWRMGDRIDFVEKEIKKSDQFKDVVEVITKTYSVDEERVESNVSMFAQRIASTTIDGITNDDVIELVTLFISELEKNPILWQPVVWIDGVWMETDSIEILDNLIIRKPTTDDLEVESYDTWSINQNLHNRPSAIFEAQLREKGAIPVQNEIESIVAALRLFKLGSVEIISTELNPNSIFSMPGGRSSTLRYIHARYKYGLSNEDVKPLNDFFIRIKPLIHSEITEKSLEESDYLSIAYDRYGDALLKSTVYENRIATAMMALEALYLKDTEKGELTERLSQRVAMALKPFGYEPLKVYNFVKQAYDVRSNYVHGSKVKQQNIVELAETILDYCRLSIILFLQIHDELEKDKLIKLLSYSLLDDSKKAEYHKLMKDKYPIH
ncbi:hypothetical protein [Methanococcoides sp. FTZ1]|uniref:hypothetical protein n=1 Tax=Methanococcoides sp. FTZ1 TaxID=3439061 RepID=UPI003F831F39